jgi:hypothetical protein
MRKLIITLEQKCDVTERHERGHSNSKNSTKCWNA